MYDHEYTLELILKAQQGDDKAKTKLVTENLPLVKSILKRYLNSHIEYEDLLQIGSLGLVKAINNFDPSFNVRFSTYAVPMIMGEIKRYIRDDGVIKVSRAIKMQYIEINKFIEQYQLENGTSPSIEQIAKSIDVDTREVVFIMDSGKFPLSLYEKIDEESQIELIDKIESENTDDKMIDKIMLNELIETLDERDKKIIILRYFRDKTQTEIATELGVSQVQISRLENKILENLRKKLQ